MKTQDIGKYGSREAAERVPSAQIKKKPTVQDLQDTLYELISQKFAVHQAHWNVQGPLFASLHELFETMYKDLEKLIDEVAERKVIIGEAADGRPEAVAEHVKLTKFPTGTISDKQSLDVLTARYLEFSDNLAQRLEQTGETDITTQDILIKVKRIVDMHLWQLRACN